MRKLILSFVILLTACASYDLQQAMRPNSRFISPKLPNMEVVFESGKSVNTNNTDSTTVQLNNEFATLFRREVEKNLVDVDGDVKGKLVLDPIFVKNEGNGLWMLTVYPGFFIPNIFGVPMSSQTATWELELNVLDKNGKRIARYSGESKDTEYFAAYWGYSNEDTAALFEGYKKALDIVIKQLQKDIPVLSDKLK